MPGVVGLKRLAVKREPVKNSKVFCRIILDCGHVLSHIQISRSDRSHYHFCQECSEAKQHEP